MAAKTVKAGVVITGKDATAGAFASLSKSLSKSENKFKAFKGSMSGLAGGIGIIGGVAVGAFAALGGAIAGVTYGMKKMLDATAAYADELGKFSRQTGFGVERLQELDFIAKRNGITTDKLRGGIVKFTKAFTDLRLGIGTGMTALKKVDPVLLKQLQGAKSADKGFALFLNRMMKIEDPAKRSTLAFAMFGKTGQQMLRLIDGGPKAFEALRLEARKFGIMTEEDTKKAEAYQDAQENLRTAVSGLKNSLGIQLMPVLTDAGTKLADFVAANRPQILAATEGLISSIGTTLKNAIDYITANPDALTNFFADAAGAIKGVVDEIKEIKIFIEDVQGLMPGNKSRRQKALERTGTTIIYGVPRDGEIPEGAAGGAKGFAAGFKGAYSAAGANAFIGPGLPYYFVEAVAEGVKNGLKSQEVKINVSTPRGVEIQAQSVSGNGPLVTEEFNYFDATTW